MKYNLTSHFHLKADKLNSMGETLIYMRVTLNGIRIELSTKMWIDPDRWNSVSVRGKGSKENIRILNN